MCFRLSQWVLGFWVLQGLGGAADGGIGFLLGANFFACFRAVASLLTTSVSTLFGLPSLALKLGWQ